MQDKGIKVPRILETPLIETMNLSNKQTNAKQNLDLILLVGN